MKVTQKTKVADKPADKNSGNQLRKIWTMGYFPFTVGGSVHQPMLTDVVMIEEREIGKGFKAFSFKTPKGTIKIAESITGAIVGDSFESVMKDVKGASIKFMQDQISVAKKKLQGARKNMSNKRFFELYNY